MSGTDADIVGISLGDLPPCRHWQRLFAIYNFGAIIYFATMQCHVRVGAVALRGKGRLPRILNKLTTSYNKDGISSTEMSKGTPGMKTLPDIPDNGVSGRSKAPATFIGVKSAY